MSARRVRLTVGGRLFLGLVPALLALLLALGLAYYGEYGRAAPVAIVLGAAALAVASLVAMWLNARHLSARIDRLTALVRASGDAREEGRDHDEFDRIERVVGRLERALSASETAHAESEARSEARLREEATLMAAVVRDASARLDEVRLPLHILAESRFGVLNENQEELLLDARGAADAMAALLERMSLIADVDRGALAVQHEAVQVNDVVRAVLPLARAAAERREARVELSLEPGLPRVSADRARLAQALALLAGAAAASCGPARALSLGTARDGSGIAIAIAPSVLDDSDPTRPEPATGSGALATRLIAAQGGRIAEEAGSLVIRLGGAAPDAPGPRSRFGSG